MELWWLTSMTIHQPLEFPTQVNQTLLWFFWQDAGKAVDREPKDRKAGTHTHSIPTRVACEHHLLCKRDVQEIKKVLLVLATLFFVHSKRFAKPCACVPFAKLANSETISQESCKDCFLTLSWDIDGPLNTKTNEGSFLYTNVPCIYLKPFQTLTSTCHSGATRLASRQLSISCAWMPRWWMRHGLRHRCASDPHRQRKLLRVWSSPHRLWWALNQKLVSKSTIVLYTELNGCEDILYPITTTGNETILDMLWDSGLRTTVFNPNHLNVSFGLSSIQ